MSYVTLGGSGELNHLEGDQVVSAIERACESDLRTALRLVARYSAYWCGSRNSWHTTTS